MTEYVVNARVTARRLLHRVYRQLDVTIELHVLDLEETLELMGTNHVLLRITGDISAL